MLIKTQLEARASSIFETKSGEDRNIKEVLAEYGKKYECSEEDEECEQLEGQEPCDHRVD